MPKSSFGAACYDVTTGHQCKESPAVSSQPESTFGNEGLRTDYEVQVTVDSLSGRLNCGSSSSEQNILDLQQIIEQSQLTEQGKFVCKMELKVRALNEGILQERQFIADYLADKKSGKKLTKEAQVKMTGLLIKYRLLKDKNDICKPYRSAGICYFSTARFSAPKEVFAKINETARKHVETNGEPSTCIFNQQEYPLAGPECEEEILSRVQVIPPPLVLAQAAQESGWGDPEKKWVRDYNNYLGLQIPFSQPKSMSCYKNCRCAAKGRRCALKFEEIDGCLYDYAMRFNASSVKPEFQKFRSARKLLNTDEIDDVKSQCKNARKLIPYLKVYAEDNYYLSHICDRLNEKICTMLDKCPKYKIKVAKKRHPFAR